MAEILCMQANGPEIWGGCVTRPIPTAVEITKCIQIYHAVGKGEYGALFACR